MGATKVSDKKSDLQGHSKPLVLLLLIGYIRFPISLPLQLCLYLV